MSEEMVFQISVPTDEEGFVLLDIVQKHKGLMK